VDKNVKSFVIQRRYLKCVSVWCRTEGW